jgi:hypothetical protein
MQYAVTRGASLHLTMDFISFGNLSQVEPLPTYFGCGDVNNGEEAYRILGLGQTGYTIFDDLILNDFYFILFFHSFTLCLVNYLNLCVFLYFLHLILFCILYSLYFDILYAFYTQHILRSYMVSEQTG